MLPVLKEWSRVSFVTLVWHLKTQKLLLVDKNINFSLAQSEQNSKKISGPIVFRFLQGEKWNCYKKKYMQLTGYLSQ